MKINPITSAIMASCFCGPGGLAAETLGWQGALFVPAGIMVVSAFVMLMFLEERPPSTAEDVAGGNQATDQSKNDPKNSALNNFLLTVTNPKLWLLGLALGLLNACRYGFLDWGLTHLKEVQDTGVGLNDDEVNHAFQGKKLSARPTAGESSTGFGLVIVRKLVERHGGRVWLITEKNSGSTFSFSLPTAS